MLIAVFLSHFTDDLVWINRWESLLLLSTSVTFFYVSGFGYTLVGFVKKHPLNHQDHIFAATFQILLGLGILSGLAVVLIGLRFDEPSFGIAELLCFALYVTGMTGSSVVEYVYFIRGSFRKLIRWGIVNQILLTLAAVVPLLCRIGFIWVTVFLALAGIWRLIHTLQLIPDFYRFANRSIHRELMRFNGPVVLSLLAGTGYIYVSQYLIKSAVSMEQFNLFRYGSRDFPLFIVMSNAFSVVLGGMYHRKVTPAELTTIRKSHLRLMHQLYPAAIVLMLGSSTLFQIAFTEQFKGAYLVFNLLLLTLIPRMVFPQSLLLGIGKSRYALIASVLEFITGLMLVWVLLPLYGISGAALAITVAYFVEKIWLIVFCYRERIPFHQTLRTGWFFMYSVLLLAAFLISIYAA